MFGRVNAKKAKKFKKNTFSDIVVKTPFIVICGFILNLFSCQNLLLQITQVPV